MPASLGYARRSHALICCGDQDARSFASTVARSRGAPARWQAFGRRARRHVAASAGIAR
jgi:hypothetical protein